MKCMLTSSKVPSNGSLGFLRNGGIFSDGRGEELDAINDNLWYKLAESTEANLYMHIAH